MVSLTVPASTFVCKCSINYCLRWLHSDCIVIEEYWTFTKFKRFINYLLIKFFVLMENFNVWTKLTLKQLLRHFLYMICCIHFEMEID